MSVARPSGPSTAPGAKSTRETNTVSMTVRYRSRMVGGQADVLVEGEAAGLRNEIVPASQRAASSS